MKAKLCDVSYFVGFCSGVMGWVFHGMVWAELKIVSGGSL
jgi:hypothetical protein